MAQVTSSLCQVGNTRIVQYWSVCETDGTRAEFVFEANEMD